MAFQITQGLFSPEFTDFHAVIGVSVEATGDVIRKRYLRVAKALHPDSFASASPSDLKSASELLSKLVNPAYKKLTAKEKDLAEYQLLLKLKAQQALRDGPPILQSSKARELLKVQNWLEYYNEGLTELTQLQYVNLQQSIAIIGSLSELNLAYLMCREAKSQGNVPGSLIGKQFVPATPNSPSPSAAKGVDPNQSIASPVVTPAPAPRPEPEQPAAVPIPTFVDAYCRRAEELISKNQFSAAIKELRDALKDDPSNSRCHELLGTVYLNQKQLTMARISFDQALKFDPKNKGALQGKAEVEKLSQDKSTKPPTSKSEKAEKSSGGLFGLFGGRKK